MNNIKVNVRWMDGYYESFDCIEVRFGLDLLWMRLNDRKIGISHFETYAGFQLHRKVAKQV